MYKNIEIIAEVKTCSPFGYVAENSWDELFNIANKIGDIISIHTDERWGGSFELLAKARKLTGKPILAKGIHASDDDVNRALSVGADWVLVVGRIPKIYQEKCMIEPFNLIEFKQIPIDSRVVWNSRDLKTGGKKKETFVQARKLWSGWLCQASFIKTVDDIDVGADAVLVGTYLKDFAQSLATETCPQCFAA